MTDTEIRIAKTEALFRNVNEHIAASAERFGADEAEFVCECDDPACTQRVEAKLDDYEHVRQESTRFILVPGHENEQVERVVARKPRYRIVEKFNETVAAMVQRLDPRVGPGTA